MGWEEAVAAGGAGWRPRAWRPLAPAAFWAAAEPLGPALGFEREGLKVALWRREGGGAALARAGERFAALAWEEGKKEPYFLSEGPESMLGEEEGWGLAQAWGAFLQGEAARSSERREGC